MDITITGLTPLQRDLADKIWACEGADDVEEFIGALPRRLQAQARLIHELMMAAVWDNVVETQQDCTEALELLDTIKNL